MRSSPFTILLIACLGVAGCGGDLFKRKPAVPPEPEPAQPPRTDPLFADTVGSRTLLSGNESLVLRGFGLVVGLGDRGGRDCPTAVRNYLVEYFNKEFTPTDGTSPRRPISPSRLIDSPDTAVVEIRAIVPPGAPRGTEFDVQVAALGVDTQSLVGGMLLPCELKIFQPDASGRGVIAGRTLARAGGAVFTNPYADPTDTASLRRGFVLGGGRSLEERTVRLLLEEPSYAMARRMQDAINERFGQSPPAGEAQSAGYVELRTPAALRDRPVLFHRLIGHLLLDNSPGYVDRKLLELTEALPRSIPKLPNIALVWEAMGQRATGALADLYGHSNPEVRFYAAQSGMRIGDTDALPVLIELARSGEPGLRRLAIRELGASGQPMAARQLAPLLDDGEQQVRIETYEALRKLGTAAIRSLRFHYPVAPYPPSFTLDVVRSGGKPLIYARRSSEARIAVFVPEQPIATPLFYASPDDRVTINANARGDNLTILVIDSYGRRLDPLTATPLVVDLIAAMAADPGGRAVGRSGAGLSYSQVIQVLDGLKKAGAIAADVQLEQITISDLLGPSRPSARPSGERPYADEPQDSPRGERPERERRPKDNDSWEQREIRRAFESDELDG